VLFCEAVRCSIFVYVFKKPKIMHVLDLWSKNGVYSSEVIQPLLDFAAAPQSKELFHAGNNHIVVNNIGMACCIITCV